MIEKEAVSIKLRVTEDIEILLLFHFNKERNHFRFAVCLGFFLYFCLAFTAQNTFRIEVVSYVEEESDFFNFALPLADIGALYVRKMTISTLTNNHKEFFFSYLTYCSIATLLSFIFVD